MFADALDLVPQASVRVNDVSVGEVSAISLDHGQAKVDIKVLKSVNVPTNVSGIISQSSLLGEKYVNLEIPGGNASIGTLKPGSTIPADKTSDELQAEDVFGALSELLNGGGIQQIQTISIELSKALTGRESNLRDLLSQFTILATSLDARRTEITRALDSVNALAKTLVSERGVIDEALADIAPGLKALDDSRAAIKKLITGITDPRQGLGAIAVDVENKTEASTVNDLRTLQPTLDRLNQAGSDIVNSLQLLVTYPFGDNALKAIFSDYTGLYATLNVDLRNGSTANPLGPMGLCQSVSNSVANQSLCSLLGTIENGVPTPPVSTSPSKSTATTATPSASAPATPANPLGGIGTLLGGGKK